MKIAIKTIALQGAYSAARGRENKKMLGAELGGRGDHQIIGFIMMIIESGCDRQARGGLGNFIADDCPRFRRTAPAAGA